MRLRIWRRWRLTSWLRLNWYGGWPSLSIGPVGAQITIGRKGVRATAGLTGTGVYLTHLEPWTQRERCASQTKQRK